jgi:hypothetical protein
MRICMRGCIIRYFPTPAQVYGLLKELPTALFCHVPARDATMRLDLSGSKTIGSSGICSQNIWSGTR